MTARFLAAAAALALAAPAPAADPKPPAVVLQVQPVGRALADIKTVAKRFGGDKAVKGLTDKIDEKFGPKGFAGLDLTKPVYGYQVLKADLQDAAGVLVFPATGETEFLDLLKRLDIEAEPVKGDAGAFELNMPDNLDPNGKDVRLRFKDGAAYVGVNVDAAALKADQLPPAADLALPGETALVAVKSFSRRVPQDVRDKLAAGGFDQATEQLDALPLPDIAKEKITDAYKVMARYSKDLSDQTDTSVFRLLLDPKTPEIGWEFDLAPLADSKLAADLGTRRPTTNRFAGLVSDQAAVGFVTRLPLFLPELRTGAADLLQLGEGFGLNSVPDQYKPAATAALRGIGRTAKTGQFDLAAGLTGPTDGGKYALAVGIAFEDPAKLEKELKELHAGLDDNLKTVIKLDAAKSAAGVSIHKLNVGAFLPPEAQAVFGDEATAAVAFAPKGIYVVVGQDSVAGMKTALAYDPTPAKVLDVVVNPRRMAQLAEATGNDGLKTAFPLADAKDDKVSVASLAVDGGKSLRVKTVFNLKLVPQAKADKDE